MTRRRLGMIGIYVILFALVIGWRVARFTYCRRGGAPIFYCLGQ